MVWVQPQFFKTGPDFGSFLGAAFCPALLQQTLFLRFKQMSIEELSYYHNAPGDFRNRFEERFGYSIRDAKYSQPDDEFVKVVRVANRTAPVPNKALKIPTRATSLSAVKAIPFTAPPAPAPGRRRA